MELDAVSNAVAAQADNRRSKDIASDLKKKKPRFFRLPFWKSGSKSKAQSAPEIDDAHARAVLSELAPSRALNVWDYMTPISADTDAPHFVWSKEATYEYASRMSSNARRATGIMVANPRPYRNWDYDDSSEDSFEDIRSACLPFPHSPHHSIDLSDESDTSNGILFRNSVASLLSELLNPRFTQVTYHAPSESRHDWTIECVFSDASKLWVASLSILDYGTYCCVVIKSLNDEANWTSAPYKRRIRVWNELCHALYLNGPFDASNKDDAESVSRHFDTYMVTFGDGRPNPIRQCSSSETGDAQITFNDKTISSASCQSIDSLKLLMRAITEHLPQCADLDAFKLLTRVTSMPSHFPWMCHLFGRSSSLSLEPGDDKETHAVAPSSSYSTLSRVGRTCFAFEFAAGCVSPIVNSSHCSRCQLDYRVLFAPNGIYCVCRNSSLSCFSMEDGSLHARFIVSRDDPTCALLVKSQSHPRLEGTTISLNDGDSKTCRRLKIDRLIATLKHTPTSLMMIDPHGLEINVESSLKLVASKQTKSGGLIVQQDNKFEAPFLSLEHTSCHQIRTLPTPSTTRCESDGLSALWYYPDHIILLWCHTVNRFAYVCILSMEANKHVTKSNYFDRDVMSFSYTQLKPMSSSVTSKRVDFRPGTQLSPTIVTNGFADQSQSQAIVIQFTTNRKDGGAGFESEEVFTFKCDVIQCGGRSGQLNAARFTRNAGLRLWLGNIATSPSNKSTLPSKGGKGSSNAGWRQLLQVATDAPDGKLRETGFFAYKACVSTDTEKPCIVTLFVPPTAMVSNWLTNEPKKRFSDVLVMSIDRIPILRDGTLDGTFKPDMPPILKSVEAMMSRNLQQGEQDAPLSDDVKIAIMCIVCGKDELQLKTDNKDVTWMRHQPCGHVCCIDCHVLCMASLKWGSILPKCPVCSKSVNNCAALEKRELMPTDFLLKWQPPREGQLLVARSIHNPTFMYRVGASIHIADFDTDLAKVCSAGVHAFVGDAQGECFRHVIEYGATNSNPKMSVSFPKETTAKPDEKTTPKTKPAAASSSSPSTVAAPSATAASHSLALGAHIEKVNMPGFSVSTATDQSKKKDKKQKRAEEPVASSSSTPDVGLKKDKKQKKAKVSFADEHSSSPLVAQYSAVSSSHPVDQVIAPLPLHDHWAVWSDEEEDVEATRPETLTQSSRAVTPSSSNVGLALWHQRDSSNNGVRTIYPSLEHWTEKPNTTLTSDSIASSSTILTPVSSVHVHAGATGLHDVSDAMHAAAPRHLVADVLLRNAIATQPEMRHLTSTTEEDLIRWDDAVEWDTSQRIPPFNRAVDLPASSSVPTPPPPSSNNLSIIDTFGASFPSVPTNPVVAERSTQSQDKAAPSASLS